MLYISNSFMVVAVGLVTTYTLTMLGALEVVRAAYCVL